MVLKSCKWSLRQIPVAPYTMKTPIMSHFKTAAFDWRATYADVDVPLFHDTEVFKRIGFVSTCSESVSQAAVHGVSVTLVNISLFNQAWLLLKNTKQNSSESPQKLDKFLILFASVFTELMLTHATVATDPLWCHKGWHFFVTLLKLSS